MPPKKRAARDSPHPDNVKRRKQSNAQDSDDTAATTASVHSTADTVQSPLFRLPPELRYAIWQLAFGNMMVHVIPVRRACSREKPRLDFVLHDLTREANDYSEEEQEAISPRTAPRPVCRQFWAEATGVFYASCVIRFGDPVAFRALARSDYTCVSRVRRIEIRLTHIGRRSITNFPKQWRHAFTGSLVGRFRNLEGVFFNGEAGWYFDETSEGPDVLDRSVWKKTKVATLISAFQQHMLRPELTSVDIGRRWSWRSGWLNWDAAPVNRAIRDELLKHHPRRLSKRGS